MVKVCFEIFGPKEVQNRSQMRFLSFVKNQWKDFFIFAYEVTALWRLKINSNDLALGFLNKKWPKWVFWVYNKLMQWILSIFAKNNNKGWKSGKTYFDKIYVLRFLLQKKNPKMDPKLDLFRFMSNVNTTCFQ